MQDGDLWYVKWVFLVNYFGFRIRLSVISVLYLLVTGESRKSLMKGGKKPQKAAEVMNKAQRLLVILIQNILKRDLILLQP